MKSTFSGSAWELDKDSNEYYLHLFSKKTTRFKLGKQRS